MTITIPRLALVVLIGPSGSGKSTFARRHFKPTEVLSSDFCRGLVADDENDQSATGDAFAVLHAIAGRRLARGLLTVIDATSVKPEDRRPLVTLAREHDVLPVAVVFDLPEKVCHERNAQRPERDFGRHVVHQQSQALRRSLRGLKREGFRNITILESPAEVEALTIERQPLWNDRRQDRGPFDIIGDVHGCHVELMELLAALGYIVEGSPQRPRVTHPEGRRAIFLGDLVDRGPDSPAVLRTVMAMVEDGIALCVPGNHDIKLRKKLQGRDVRITHGLAETLQQLEGETAEFKEAVVSFIEARISHYVLDGGGLVVAHAGLKQEFQGRASARVRDFCLYGETTGETDEFGLPVRYNWAADYRGPAMVIYGHSPVPEPVWLNRTLCIDTGCVFGGRLTALRYPERALVHVPAHRMYYEPARPLTPIGGEAAAAGTPRTGDLLDIGDVRGKRIVSTRIHHNVTIREENGVAALEVMSRFAADPRWILYLPPTMSPPATCRSGEFLEHPREAFDYYGSEETPQVVCQEKHMGSRAVLVVCRDAGVAHRRFGMEDEGAGIVYTRTGRPFFSDTRQQNEMLDRLRAAMEAARFWERLETDWVCLDAEILPWSAKAQELLRGQYAPAGAAGTASLEAAVEALRQASDRDGGSNEVLTRFQARRETLRGYIEAYRRYCWKVESTADLRIAPFHLLATEGRTYFDRDHVWHMETLGGLCGSDTSLLRPTAWRLVEPSDATQVEAGIAWWTDLTSRGGEGMVVKPREWFARGRRGLVQPAVKCRGREYLRIIYGPDYTLPDQLDRLRERGLSAKRSLAIREFALGVEALSRFVEKEPLYRVHECVFGVLALESEPVDPRL